MIAKVASFLSRERTQYQRFVIKIPLNNPIGNVFYTVESELDPVTFLEEKDAKALQRLLRKSTLALKSDIVRREVTDEGFIPTYGDRK